MKKTTKTYNFPCECVSGSRECGFLRLIVFAGGDCEFAWIKRKNQSCAKIGVYLNDKTMKKLKKLL